MFCNSCTQVNADYQNIWKSFTTSLHTRHCQAYSKISFVSKTVNIYNIDIINAIITDLTEKSCQTKFWITAYLYISKGEDINDIEVEEDFEAHRCGKGPIHLSLHLGVSMLFLECCKSGIVYICIILLTKYIVNEILFHGKLYQWNITKNQTEWNLKTVLT